MTVIIPILTSDRPPYPFRAHCHLPWRSKCLLARASKEDHALTVENFGYMAQRLRQAPTDGEAVRYASMAARNVINSHFETIGILALLEEDGL